MISRKIAVYVDFCRAQGQKFLCKQVCSEFSTDEKAMVDVVLIMNEYNFLKGILFVMLLLCIRFMM